MTVRLSLNQPSSCCLTKSRDDYRLSPVFNLICGFPEWTCRFPCSTRWFTREVREFTRQGREFTRAGREFPRQGCGFPRAGREFPRPGREFPREVRGFPRAGREFPRQGREFPRQGREFPRAEREFPGQVREFTKWMCGFTVLKSWLVLFSQFSLLCITLTEPLGILLTLAYLAFFTWLIGRWKHFDDQEISRKWFTLFFFYKMVLGLTLTLIYTYYYSERQTADIFKYFDDSEHMTRALWEKPSDFFRMLFGMGNDTQYFTDTYYAKMNHWFRLYETQVYNDNHTMIRFNALVRIFSMGYFHVHTLFMCFLSFWGMVSFYKGFALYLPAHKHKILALALFLFPSLNFWSAGVLKEGLLVFALGNIFYAACLFATGNHKKWYYALAGFSFFISLYIKSYALGALGVGLAGLVLASLFLNRHVVLSYIAVILTLVLTVFMLQQMYPGYHIPSIVAQKQSDFFRFSQEMQSGSMFSIGQTDASWASLFQQAPLACFTTLFRPLPLETGGLLALVSSLESLLLIAGVILCCVFFERPGRRQLSMILCCVMVIILLGTVIGLATTNFGSLVRYKVPVIPFMVFICICLVNTERFKRKTT